MLHKLTIPRTGSSVEFLQHYRAQPKDCTGSDPFQAENGVFAPQRGKVN